MTIRSLNYKTLLEKVIELEMLQEILWQIVNQHKIYQVQECIMQEMISVKGHLKYQLEESQIIR